jgi:hypothetical protein
LARDEADADPRYALAVVSPTSWAPYDYLKRFMPDAAPFSGVDESHNTRGDNSDIALRSPAPNVPPKAPATHLAPTTRAAWNCYCYWFRFAPDFWLRLGYTWKDINKAIEDYGFATYTTREVPSNDRRRSGLSEYRTRKTSAPGISSRLLPELLSQTWTLVGPDGEPYASDQPGTLGGHRRSRIYGRLDCPAALRAIARGGYVTHRVFFLTEDHAWAAGCRSCAVCLPAAYASWKAEQTSGEGA